MGQYVQSRQDIKIIEYFLIDIKNHRILCTYAIF